MPAFQQPVLSAKRKHSENLQVVGDDEPFRRKRISLGASPDFEEGASGTIARGISQSEQIWMVQWRNPQYKKHKTWDGDAILVVTGKAEASLYDSDGKIMSTSKVLHPLYEGKSFSVGSKEIELERTISRESFLSGSCFGVSTPPTDTPSSVNTPKKFTPPSFAVQTRPKESKTSIGVALVTKGSMPGKIYALDGPSNSETSLSEITNQLSHWAANWRKPQDKKNKTWDGDAYVSLLKDKLVMISEDGKMMGSAQWKGQKLCSGLNIFIGGKEVELDLPVSVDHLPVTQEMEQKTESEKSSTEPPENSGSKENRKFVSPADFYGVSKPKVKKPLPSRHNPHDPDSIVMKAPTKEHTRRYNKKNLPIVDVVVDPIIGRKLRPHQREGVKFLYESVMGLRRHEGQGCILADEMGLGKTLQTIALVWTLLRQNPYAGPFAAVQKVLIVCPVSLVNNWKAEFHKWLGRDRLGIMTCDKNHADVDLFGRSKVYEVLIVGYERLRTIIGKLANIYPPIGLIICDEGHRLKSANNKTTNVFKSLDTRRRIILSGTPIQNDLGEFHAMAEFCNPGLLDDYSVFRKVYETPILKSRAPGASAKDISKGEGQTEQLLAIAKSFVLRRDATLLKNHLPPKTEYVVFVVPTSLQLEMYHKILHPKKLDDLIHSSTADSLALINILVKISNSPILLKATADSARTKNDDSTPSIQKTAVKEALALLPDKAHIADLTLGGKLIFLSNTLKVLRQNTSEKCVLVSHYTSTLNILEAYCKKMSYSYYRLDGQTPQNKRQEYVNAFNTGNQHNGFIFLLSSKAGGVGINLIGGSRLFIIDSDWNPSHDLQAMARCHRDGQKRPVFIYRILTAGAIDEKIYQRQVTKLALSDSLIGSGTSSSKSDSFTRKDLRDIFRIHPDTACNTHDLLECGCDLDVFVEDSVSIGSPGEGEPATNIGFVAASNVSTEDLDAAEKAYFLKKKAGLASLGQWKHINCLKPPEDIDTHVHDDILRRIVNCPPEKPTDPRSRDATRLETLLTGVDISAIQAIEGRSVARNAPGGTVSFLFERCSNIDLEEDINNVEE